MTDILSKLERSARMSLIRSKWTKPEKWLHDYLKAVKVRHKMHPRIKGSPDIILPEKKMAIFVHGCFWHGCKNCYRQPRTNVNFWKNKINSNVERHKINENILKKSGWKCKIVWEHEIPRTNRLPALRRIVSKLT